MISILEGELQFHQHLPGRAPGGTRLGLGWAQAGLRAGLGWAQLPGRCQKQSHRLPPHSSNNQRQLDLGNYFSRVSWYGDDQQGQGAGWDLRHPLREVRVGERLSSAVPTVPGWSGGTVPPPLAVAELWTSTQLPN